GSLCSCWCSSGSWVGRPPCICCSPGFLSVERWKKSTELLRGVTAAKRLTQRRNGNHCGHFVVHDPREGGAGAVRQHDFGFSAGFGEIRGFCEEAQAGGGDRQP